MLRFAVGDRVEGHDDFYDCDLAGVVTEAHRTRSGEYEALFNNELAGPFEGQRVALLASQIERVL